jgi:predicted metal-binding membrane protein
MPIPSLDNGRRTTLLHAALLHDRTPLILLLVLVPLVCWWWIVVMARDMYGPMTGASAWMMTPRWDAPHLLLLWAMWAVMMIGMMLPSAAPMILLAGGAARQNDANAPARQTYLLALGYVVVWAVFSIGATALQWGLGRLLVLTPMMEVSSRSAGAIFLVLAGVYQWTPLKRACLSTCQSPLAFLMRRWRSGSWGAFRMGVEHGAYCVGCCWALMLLLFAGGVMNLTVIAALTAFVAFEKLAPVGVQSTRVSGLLLVAAAAWMLVSG